MKTTTRIIALTAIALATLAAAQAANACKITRTPWGLRISDCKLGELYGGRYDMALSRNPTPPPIRLPNLIPTDVDATVIDKAVDLSFDLLNNGYGNAGPFEVTVMVSVNDPLNGGVPTEDSPIALPPVPVPGLAAGAGARGFAGRIHMLNRTQDWDICPVAMVDPPLTGGASWGRVVEVNEEDNEWPPKQQSGCCRVYGPKPDVSTPAC